MSAVTTVADAEAAAVTAVHAEATATTQQSNSFQILTCLFDRPLRTDARGGCFLPTSCACVSAAVPHLQRSIPVPLLESLSSPRVSQSVSAYSLYLLVIHPFTQISALQIHTNFFPETTLQQL